MSQMLHFRVLSRKIEKIKQQHKRARRIDQERTVVEVNRLLKLYRREKRKNATLLRRFANMVHFRQHYLRHRLGNKKIMPSLTKVMGLANQFRKDLKSIRSLRGFRHMTIADKSQKSKFYVKLDTNQFKRLKGMLNSNHSRCVRPRKGNVIVALPMNQAGLLKRFLDRLSERRRFGAF